MQVLLKIEYSQRFRIGSGVGTCTKTSMHTFATAVLATMGRHVDIVPDLSQGPR